MNFNYYGVDVLMEIVPRRELPRGDGACWMDWGDNVALVRIADDLSEDQLLKTLNHELGHVWQGIKSDELTTEVNWPKTHYGASLSEEDFPEALRVALCGLDLDRDEDILFEWVQGVLGVYQARISREKEDALIATCRAEVVRLLGFMPEVQTL